MFVYFVFYFLREILCVTYWFYFCIMYASWLLCCYEIYNRLIPKIAINYRVVHNKRTTGSAYKFVVWQCMVWNVSKQCQKCCKILVKRDCNVQYSWPWDKKSKRHWNNKSIRDRGLAEICMVDAVWPWPLIYDLGYEIIPKYSKYLCKF